ncbi:MAG TPA: hypothetical protein VJB61_23370 [Actinomycetota bacterium]
MSHAGSEAIFDFLQICRHSVKLVFAVRPPADPKTTAGDRLPAIYRRIQAATPPPERADQRPWASGILVADGSEGGRPLRPEDGDEGWKKRGVKFVEDIASLGLPDPATIVLDQWLTVPANPITWPFSEEVDPRGFLSASYPQPVIGAGGVAHVPVDYREEYELSWSRPLPAGSRWVAFSFDRFWPPERESVEYIGWVEEDCAHPAPDGQEQSAQATATSV